MGRVTRKQPRKYRRKKHHNTIYDTPKRARVEGVHEYLTAKGIPYSDREIFTFFGIEERPGRGIVKEGAPSRTKQHREGYNETRGRPLKLTGADVRETDHLLEENRLEIEAKGMPWDAISWTIDFEVSGKTLQRTMRDALTYSKYLSALKEHLPERLMQKREKWAGDMYAEYPKPEDWENIRFSDEVYAGYSAKEGDSYAISPG